MMQVCARGGRPRRRLLGRGGRDERGASAVEFALVVPPLVLILFGIVSYGFMLTFRQGLSQAAAEGARAAAVQVDATQRTTSAQTAVNNALSGSPGGAITCSSGNLYKSGRVVGSCTIGTPVACSGQSSAQCITVSLRYNYRANPSVPSAPLVDNLIPTTLPYSATVRVS